MNPLEAKEDMFTRFLTAWNAGDPGNGIDTTGWPIHWPDQPFEKPITQIPWLRITLRNVDSGQASLADHEGKRRWRREGFIMVQIFVPAADGERLALKLVSVVKNAFEGKATTGGVWFRNVRWSEIGVDGDWYQVNVIADFNYDEVK